jgi:hypothetical protein
MATPMAISSPVGAPPEPALWLAGAVTKPSATTGVGAASVAGGAALSRDAVSGEPVSASAAAGAVGATGGTVVVGAPATAALAGALDEVVTLGTLDRPDRSPAGVVVTVVGPVVVGLEPPLGPGSDVVPAGAPPPEGAAAVVTVVDVETTRVVVVVDGR